MSTHTKYIWSRNYIAQSEQNVFFQRKTEERRNFNGSNSIIHFHRTSDNVQMIQQMFDTDVVFIL